MSLPSIARTVFVTGTDTDAGKTVVSCALLRGLSKAGVVACGFKPVASGAVVTPDGLVSEDAQALLAASAPGFRLDEINPCVFAPAIAPHLAAAAAHQPIDAAALLSAHARLASRCERVVAEGAGGWLTPLGDSLLLGDWVAAQRWPVLLVVRLRLGCLNHALLSAEAIRRRAPWVGWVANLAPPVPMEREGILATLSRHLGDPVWVQAAQTAAPSSAIESLFALGRGA